MGFEAKLRSTVLPILVVIFMISFISAAFPVDELFDEDVSNLTITIKQDESWANFYLNTAGTSFDNRTYEGSFPPVGEPIANITYNYLLSDIFNAVDGEIKIRNGSSIPQVESFHVDDTSLLSLILNDILNQTTAEHYTINQLNDDCATNGCSIMNSYLAMHSHLPVSGRDTNLSKNGNDYYLWNNKGYGDVDGYKSEIRRIINKTFIDLLSARELAEAVIPIIDPNLEVGERFLSQLDWFEGYEIQAINLDNVRLEDGHYQITVNVVNAELNRNFTKQVYLILEGIENVETNQNPSNGTYTPESPEVEEYINEITGLGNATSLSITLFDVFSSILPSNTLNVIKYLEIFTDGINGTIKFKVPASEVVDTSRVSLYVLENTGWVKLPTTFLGLDGVFYEFEATTPHFSTFMIMESAALANSGGSETQYSGYIRTSASGTGTGNQGNLPINLNPPEEDRGFFAGITGAFIGTLGTGGSILVLAFMLTVVVLAILAMRAGKKPKKSKVVEEEKEED